MIACICLPGPKPSRHLLRRKSGPCSHTAEGRIIDLTLIRCNGTSLPQPQEYAASEEEEDDFDSEEEDEPRRKKAKKGSSKKAASKVKKLPKIKSASTVLSLRMVTLWKSSN